MFIRKAKLSDLDRIKEIEDLVFKRQGINETRATIKSRIAAFSKGCFVTVQNGKVIGYALSELRRKITRFALNYDARARHSPKGPYVYLSNLAADPKFQDRGIGRKLLEMVIVTAKRLKMKAVLLTTWYARDYYPKFGFKVYRKIYNKKGKLSYFIFYKQVA